MAEQDFFEHRDTEARVYKTGYQGYFLGENLAAGFKQPRDVFQAWQNSPGHNKLLLHPKINEIGLGVYVLADDMGNFNFRTYWALDAGSKNL